MRILIIDDEVEIRNSLSKFVKRLGHTVMFAQNGNDGLKKLENDAIDLVITDIRMPEMDGIEFLRHVKRVLRSPVIVIVITGYGDLETTTKALKYGAYDYLQKPIDVQELAITLERSLEYAILRKKYMELAHKVTEQDEKTAKFKGSSEHFREAYLQEIGLGDMQVHSGAMRNVISLAEKYSRDRTVPVLIEGESGTGKELVAKLIHFYWLEDQKAQFVALNCSAIPHHLFEGELFGHDPGSFTGASKHGRIGKFEAAKGGSIFFDEIGELELGLQAKLLRVLEEKKFHRIGGTEEIEIDFRIISATNKNVKTEVKKGAFRLDLFYRLNMGYIKIPPLRDRKEDILPLANLFIRKALLRQCKEFSGFSSGAEDYLKAFSWPGNIRQLKNAMGRLSIMTTGGFYNSNDVSEIVEQSIVDEIDFETTPVLNCSDFQLPESEFDLSLFNRSVVQKALKMNKGNKTKTAQYLNISRRVLEGRIKKYSL
ncbi:MAG: sigma-54 dependent transcriptional regulator [Desulfobacterales bacterium]|nr:sigma-54 dependent transcriptional regulator [Desulfobacterales bacterium]